MQTFARHHGLASIAPIKFVADEQKKSESESLRDIAQGLLKASERLKRDAAELLRKAKELDEAIERRNV